MRSTVCVVVSLCWADKVHRLQLYFPHTGGRRKHKRCLVVGGKVLAEKAETVTFQTAARSPSAYETVTSLSRGLNSLFDHPGEFSLLTLATVPLSSVTAAFLPGLKGLTQRENSMAVNIFSRAQVGIILIQIKYGSKVGNKGRPACNSSLQSTGIHSRYILQSRPAE